MSFPAYATPEDNLELVITVRGLGPLTQHLDSGVAENNLCNAGPKLVSAFKARVCSTHSPCPAAQTIHHDRGPLDCSFRRTLSGP